MDHALGAAVDALVQIGARLYLRPLHWLGVGEARRRALARMLLALGALSFLLLALSPAPLEWYLWLILLPQRVPRLVSAALSVGA